MGIAAVAVGDAICTFLWVFLSSWLGVAAILLGPYIGESKEVQLVALLCLLVLLLIAFTPVCNALGGASFNLSGNLALLVAGFEKETPLKLAVRLPAQAMGAVAGAVAILRVMPEAYHHTLSKPELGPNVDIVTGMVVEGAVTGLMNLAVVWSVYSSARDWLKSAALLMLTVVLVVAGSPYSGPYMNPSNALGLAYLHGTHETKEHFLVYWLAPLVASVLASFVFRLFWRFPSATNAKATRKGKKAVTGKPAKPREDKKTQ